MDQHAGNPIAVPGFRGNQFPAINPTARQSSMDWTKKSSRYKELWESLECKIVDRSEMKTRFSDIQGLAEVKTALENTVVLPMKFPRQFKRKYSSVILCGRPGIDIYRVAEAAAFEVPDTTFISVNLTDLASSYGLESAEAVRVLFDLARFRAPTLLFLNDMDCIGSLSILRKETGQEAEISLRTELFDQMDAAFTADKDGDNTRRVFVLGTGSRPDVMRYRLWRHSNNKMDLPLPRIPFLIERQGKGTGSTIE